MCIEYMCVHVSVIHTCSIFDFKNEQRGKITFEGNLLFTHFGEIGAPKLGSEVRPNEYTFTERSTKEVPGATNKSALEPDETSTV